MFISLELMPKSTTAGLYAKCIFTYIFSFVRHYWTFSESVAFYIYPGGVCMRVHFASSPGSFVEKAVCPSSIELLLHLCQTQWVCLCGSISGFSVPIDLCVCASANTMQSLLL